MIYKEIRTKINQIEDIRDLQTITDIIKLRLKDLASRTKKGLKLGDKVQINGSSKIRRGTITKINRTRAVVNIDDRLWNVPFSMITKEI